MTSNSEADEQSSVRVWDRLAGKIGIALTIAVSIALLVTPLVTEGTDTTDGVTTESTLTLVQSEGWGIAIILAVPVVFAIVIGLAPPTYSRAAYVGFAVLAIMTSASIGLLYMPGVIVLAFAVFRRRRSVAKDPDAT